MNEVDLIILGAVTLMALIGLKSGFLRAASGIGGLALGVVLAIHYSADVAGLLVDYVEAETVRRVAAFAGIMIVVAVAARVTAALMKKLLSALALGWLDHVVGGVAGASLGIVLVGTAVYMLTGADLGSTRDQLAASQLAPKISRATFITAPTPWCSSIRAEPSPPKEDCTDLIGLFNDLVGQHIPGRITNLLGHDADTVSEVVKGVLTGSSADIQAILETKK